MTLPAKLKRLDVVAGIAQDQSNHEEVQTAMVSRLSEAEYVPLLTTIARRTTESKVVREAALDVLSKAGDAGWQVIEGLKDDAEVGKKARKLLEEREKKLAEERKKKEDKK